MNTYRCPQCNLTNWMSIDLCKRCKARNPYFVPENNSSANQNEFGEPQMAQPFPTQQANYNQQTFAAPPVNQTSFGNAQQWQGNNYAPYGNNYQANYGQPNYYQNSYQPGYQSAADPYSYPEEVGLALKQVQHAAFAGFIWSVLLFILCVIGYTALNSISNDPRVMNNPAFPKKEISDMLFYIGFASLVIFGLSFGVKKESLICGILLLLFSAITVISSIFQAITIKGGAQIGGAAFGVFIFFWIAVGVRGLVVLKKY